MSQQRVYYILLSFFVDNLREREGEKTVMIIIIINYCLFMQGNLFNARFSKWIKGFDGSGSNSIVVETAAVGQNVGHAHKLVIWSRK
jgi:hypothetical protein